jgi:hypothetical protein
MLTDRGEVPLIRKALQLSGRAAVRVAGTSMLPAIVPGSQVTIERWPFADVRAGEIVAFTLSGTVLIHRVTERDGVRLLTIGDNMPLFDPPVTADAYLGRVAGPPALPVAPVPAARSAGGLRLAGLTLWCPSAPGRVPSADALVGAGARLRIAADPVPALARKAQPGRAGTPRGARRIGVSAAGRATAATLSALVIAGGVPCDVLVGYRFGSPRRGSGLLDPGTADHHVRVAAPLEEVPLGQMLDTVAAALRDDAAGPDPRLAAAGAQPR